MKTFFIIVGFLLLFVAGTIAAAPFFVSSASIRNVVAEAVKERTGRTLTIAGDTSISMFPNIGVKVGNVTLSNAKGFGKAPFAKMAGMTIRLKLMPLLVGKVSISRFVLVAPQINLTVNAKGNNNWNLLKSSAPSAAQTSDDSSLAVSDVELGVFDISNGVIRYTNAQTGAKERVQAINLRVTMANLASLMTAKGSFIWNKNKVDLDTQLGTLGALLEKKSAKFSTNISTTHFKAGFKGTAALADSPVLKGALNFSTSSLRALSKWLKSPLAPGRGMGKFEVTSTIASQGQVINLTKARISLDGMQAKGTALVRLTDAKPHIRSRFSLDKLDVNQYISPASKKPAKRSKSSGWSTARIDLSGLKAIDGDIQIDTKKILYGKVVTGLSQLNVKLKGGHLTANLAKLALYKGHANLVLTLDGSNAKQIIRVRGKMTNFDAYPLLRDAAQFEWIEGRANFEFDVVTRGKNQKQMMTNLSGRGVTKFNNGAIRGINIAKMFRSVSSDILSGWSKSKSEKTDFSELGASFAIVRGIATNKDLRLIGPLVRIKGAGTVAMPKQRIDYKVSPKLVASLKGQGGNKDLGGINVPIIIKGPWANPSIYPDIEGILKNPAEAFKNLNLKKTLKKGGIGDLINAVTKPKSGKTSKPKLKIGKKLKSLKKLF